jgi:uncharacterized protein (TIGR00270 family)
MAICEMCGKDSYLTKSKIEGSTLSVCKPCSAYGTAVISPKGVFVRKRKFGFKDEEKTLINDFSQKFRREREKRKMTQKEFANFLNEKLSLIQHWESGKMNPSLALAKKLEIKLNVKFVEGLSRGGDDGGNGDSSVSSKKKSGELTLGDFIKVRKRK